MAHVRSARPRKLGGAFLKIEILQFGMGIEPPQISLLGGVYVNAPAPRPTTPSSLNPRGRLRPTPCGAGVCVGRDFCGHVVEHAGGALRAQLSDSPFRSAWAPQAEQPIDNIGRASR